MAFHTLSERAYAAGILDGEGCIVIDRSHRPGAGNPYHSLRVTISNTSVSLLEWLADRWEGSSRTVTPYTKEGGMPVHTITFSGRKAGAFLEELLPWLIVKREQAELGIAFIQTIGRIGVKLSAEVIVLRDEMRADMKLLKKKVV